MAEKKSAEDRVADLDKKIKQMQAQKRAILQREKEAARKARTKRLIRIGAEVEAYCGEITDLDAFKDYLQQYSAAIRGTQKKEQKDSRYDPDDLLAFLGQDQETQKKQCMRISESAGEKSAHSYLGVSNLSCSS